MHLLSPLGQRLGTKSHIKTLLSLLATVTNLQFRYYSYIVDSMVKRDKSNLISPFIYIIQVDLVFVCNCKRRFQDEMAVRALVALQRVIPSIVKHAHVYVVP